MVSTRLSGIPEIVGEEAGVLVTPGNEEELADAIVEVAQQLRAGRFDTGIARGRAEKLFDLRKNVRELHNFFVAESADG